MNYVLQLCLARSGLCISALISRAYACLAGYVAVSWMGAQHVPLCSVCCRSIGRFQNCIYTHVRNPEDSNEMHIYWLNLSFTLYTTKASSRLFLGYLVHVTMHAQWRMLQIHHSVPAEHICKHRCLLFLAVSPAACSVSWDRLPRDFVIALQAV